MAIPSVAVTGYSGLFQTTANPAPYELLTSTVGGNRVRTETLISKLLRKKGNAVLREIIVTLTAGAVGDTAAVTARRVVAQETDPSTPLGLTDLSGVRTTEAESLINRVTTAADITYVGQMLERLFAPSTYPTNGSGLPSGGLVNRIA